MANVSDLLAKKGNEVVSVNADTTVLVAAQRMNEHGFGGVVVLRGGELAGIFTERDVLRRVVAAGRDPAATTVGEVMTAPVFTCRPDTRLEACLALVSDKRVRHLPVVDDDGLCGIVTSGDLIARQVDDQQDLIRHLHNYVFDQRG